MVNQKGAGLFSKKSIVPDINKGLVDKKAQMTTTNNNNLTNELDQLKKEHESCIRDRNVLDEKITRLQKELNLLKTQNSNNSNAIPHITNLKNSNANKTIYPQNTIPTMANLKNSDANKTIYPQNTIPSMANLKNSVANKTIYPQSTIPNIGAIKNTTANKTMTPQKPIDLTKLSPDKAFYGPMVGGKDDTEYYKKKYLKYKNKYLALN